MTNEEVVVEFLKKDKKKGRNSNGSISFEDSKLYSYDTVIAQFSDRDSNVLLVEEHMSTYSATTSKHLSLLNKELRRFSFKVVPIYDYGGTDMVNNLLLYKLYTTKRYSVLRADGPRDLYKVIIDKLDDQLITAIKISGLGDQGRANARRRSKRITTALEQFMLWDIPINKTVNIKVLEKKLKGK